jgi:hypothetical protein
VDAAVDAEFAEALRITEEKQAAERLAAENAAKLEKAKKDLAKSQLDALLNDNDIKFSKKGNGANKLPKCDHSAPGPGGGIVSGYGAFL